MKIKEKEGETRQPNNNNNNIKEDIWDYTQNKKLWDSLGLLSSFYPWLTGKFEINIKKDMYSILWSSFKPLFIGCEKWKRQKY